MTDTEPTAKPASTEAPTVEDPKKRDLKAIAKDSYFTNKVWSFEEHYSFTKIVIGQPGVTNSMISN